MRRLLALICVVVPLAAACSGGLPLEGSDASGPDAVAQDGTTPIDANQDTTVDQSTVDVTSNDVATSDATDALDETADADDANVANDAALDSADATLDAGSDADATLDASSDADASLDGPYDASDGGTLVLASSLNNPFKLVVDSNNVYWTNRDGGSVMQCAIGGCNGTPTVLGSAEATPTGITVDSTNVYWANNSGGGGTIRSCPIGGGDGGGPKTIASSSVIAPVDVAVSGSNVYFTDQSADKVQVCPTTGCSSTPPVIASSQGGANGLAIDSTTLYWTATVNNTIMDIALGGDAGTQKTVQSGAEAAWIAVDSGYLYWATYTGGNVIRCTATNCGNTFVVLGISQTGLTGFIATDGVNAYWTVGGSSGSVMKCAVGGCNNKPTTLASSLSYPLGLAVDGTSVYVALATSVIKLTPK
jgi:hypothetical protein